VVDHARHQGGPSAANMVPSPREQEEAVNKRDPVTDLVTRFPPLFARGGGVTTLESRQGASRRPHLLAAHGIHGARSVQQPSLGLFVAAVFEDDLARLLSTLEQPRDALVAESLHDVVGLSPSRTASPSLRPVGGKDWKMP
jgi:hypothetical protein